MARLKIFFGNKAAASGGATYTVTATANGVLQTTFAKTTTASGVLQAAFAKTASADAVLQAISSSTVTAVANAALQKAFTVSADGNAQLQKTFSSTALTNALLQKQFAATASVSAVLQKNFGITAQASAYLYQDVTSRYARPDADVSTGAWTPSTGTTLWEVLDEETASDADYIQTTSASSCVIRLSDPSDPGTSANHVLRYRASSSNANRLIATLKQGATVIATRTHTSVPASFTTLEMVLTAGEIDSITDYTDLTVTLEAQ